MTDIILSVKNNEAVVSSRQIAENFGKEHKVVLRAIENIKAQNCALTSMFFEATYIAGTGKAYPMYLMNRDGFSLLVMGFTGKSALEWKLKYITAFNEMEKQLTQPKQLSKTEILSQALLIANEELEESKKQITALTAKNAELIPKAEFADAISASKATILIGSLATLLKQNGCDIGQNRLFRYLRENGYLISQKGDRYNTPTQRAMDMGLFEVETSLFTTAYGNAKISYTTRVTPKGQQHFIDKFVKERGANLMIPEAV